MRRLFFLFLGLLALPLNALPLGAVLQATGVLVFADIEPRNFVLAWVVFGLVGAAVALLMAESVADWSVEARPYADGDVRASGDLRAAAERLGKAAGLARTPALMVFAGRELSVYPLYRGLGRATITVSSAVLDRPKTEIDALLAEALAKLAAGDVPILILLAGAVQTFSIFPTRMFSLLMGTSLRTSTEETPMDAIETGMVLCLEVALAPFSGLVVRAAAWSARRHAAAEARRLLSGDGYADALARLADRRAPSARELFTAALAFRARVR